jgi:4-amino-4-deoxy-L-arabinose transferase-like glycosyltransferase
MFTDKLQSERVTILSLLLLALVIRLIALDRICLIARDGIHYVSLAGLFMSGSIVEGLSHPYHPLYQALIALVASVIGDAALAGQLLNLTLSSLTIIPLYLIGRFVYGPKGGIITGLFFAVQPYCVRFSVDVLSDPTFLFFFVLAFYFGLKAGCEEKNSAWWGFGAGVSSGLAYLTRPEGILIIAFLLPWYFWRWLCYPKQQTLRTLAVMACFLFGFSVFAGPYVLFIKTHTGNWHLSMKPSVSKAFKTAAPVHKTTIPTVSRPAAPQPERNEPPVLAPAKPKESSQRPAAWKSITHPPLKFIETYPYLLFLFLLIGVSGRYPKDSRNLVGVLAVFLLAYVLCLCYLYYSVSYVSRRHFIPPLVLSLPLAAIGFWEVKEYCAAYSRRFDNKLCRLFTRHATVFIILITVLTLAPKALKPQRADKLPLKNAAAWIHTNAPSASPVVMSNEPLVAYYSGGRHTYIPALSYEAFMRFVQKNRVDFLVLGAEEVSRGALFLQQLPGDTFKKAYTEDGRALVYEIIL